MVIGIIVCERRNCWLIGVHLDEIIIFDCTILKIFSYVNILSHLSASFN